MFEEILTTVDPTFPVGTALDPASPSYTPGGALDYLRKRFPELDALADIYVEACLEYMELRRVSRVGFSKMWFYARRFFSRKHGHTKVVRKRVPAFLPWDEPFNVAEHTLFVANEITLFEEIFGKYIPILYHYQPQWHEMVKAALDHDVGEIVTSDLADDGSHDLVKKAKNERRAYQNYVRNFPKEMQDRRKERFGSVNDQCDEVKLFDKEEFLISIAYCREHCFEGDMTHSRYLSKSDKEYCERTGSRRCLDTVYASMLDHYRMKPWLPFFMLITEALYRNYYNSDFDPLVDNYVPGCPPPGVRTFYF